MNQSGKTNAVGGVPDPATAHSKTNGRILLALRCLVDTRIGEAGHGLHP